MVMRSGKIEAVGRRRRGAGRRQVIDGTGLFVYPGPHRFRHRLGLTEIGSVPGGEDTQELGSLTRTTTP